MKQVSTKELRDFLNECYHSKGINVTAKNLNYRIDFQEATINIQPKAEAVKEVKLTANVNGPAANTAWLKDEVKLTLECPEYDDKKHRIEWLRRPELTVEDIVENYTEVVDDWANLTMVTVTAPGGYMARVITTISLNNTATAYSNSISVISSGNK